MQYSLLTIDYSWLYRPLERESSMIQNYILVKEILKPLNLKGRNVTLHIRL